MPRSGQAVFHNIALPVDETLEFDQYVVFGASLVHEWNMFDTEIDQTKNWQLTRIASLEKISGKEGRIATIRQEA